MRERKGK
jgi:hypothetical protein